MRSALTALAILSLSLSACGGGKSSSADTRTFWTWDLSIMPPGEKQVDATLRLTTEHAYVYVEDVLWGTDVTQADLDDLEIALEDATPAGSVNVANGIFENDIATFGPVPDALDNDPRVYLLLMDIEGFQNFTFDGFFRSLDQLTDAQAVANEGYHSNEIEMLFVNAKIRRVNTTTTKSIIAHELFHLLEWGLDPNGDEGWMSEAMGELAMTINGYYTDTSWVADFMAHPEEPLKGGQFSVHYGACLLWANYLYERFGASFMTDLAGRDNDGTAAIEDALTAAGAGVNFEQVFLDWVAANGAHAPGAAGFRGYDFADVPLVTPWQSVTAVPFAAQTASVPALASRYVRLSGLGAVTVQATVVTSVAADARLVLLRYDSANRDTVDVTFPAVSGTNTTTFPVDLTGPYDEALIGLVGMNAQTFTVSVDP